MGPFSAIPGPPGMVSGHSGTLSRPSGPFSDVLELSGWVPGPRGLQLIIPMNVKVIGVSSDNPKTILVDPGLPQYHSHML